MADITRRDSFFAGRHKWFRHSKYEIVESDGWLYIRPAAKARLEFYRPFDYFPAILEDYLRFAQSLRYTNKEEDRPSVAEWNAKPPC